MATLKTDDVRELLAAHTDGQCEALVDEFVREAEHQDGLEVWENLYGNDPQTIRDDFDLYRSLS